MINIESANVFFTFVKSYILNLSDYSQVDYDFINKVYSSYGYIADAVKYFENKNLDSFIDNNVNRTHVGLLRDFDVNEYVEFVINEIEIENKSIKHKIIKLVKKII